uniref:Transmembrane protein n=1 Tax=Stomoxys calcitrans TaxID=35570 RepID=A0A1I8NLR8_STOCA
MCCTSQRNFGLIVAWLNVGLSSLSLILILVSWLAYDVPQTSGDSQIEGIVLLALVFTYVGAWLALSALLVKGIVEERHKLMAPWVYMTISMIFLLTFIMAYTIIASIVANLAFIVILLELIIISLTLCVIVSFFFPVFMLFIKIREKISDPEKGF